MSTAYAEFLDRKTHSKNEFGFAPTFMPAALFDFQQALIEWSLRCGRSAIWADCGLGKTAMQLTWAENVVRETNGRVLVLTPLAVSPQTMREGEKFGIEVRRSKDGVPFTGITVTNYERLEKFNPADFVGVVCDESSILKSFDGATKDAITAFMRKVPYRLLCTATAAPNDYVELGTSSEALGYLGAVDMLNRFFKNDQNTSDTSTKWRNQGGKDRAGWRFKGHAETPFWRWVCSWARSIRKPSDLGFDDNGFKLPELREIEHFTDTRTLPPGHLFPKPAEGLFEQREERRRTINERCEAVAQLATSQSMSLVWCQLNDEGDLLEKLIPGAVQISGSDSDEAKEEAFTAFAEGSLTHLVTKSKIAGWGLNFQRCSHITTFPTHSYEQHYQGIRRCWRFGQKNPVTVDIVATEGDRAILENLKAKAAAADRMFSALVAQMNNAMAVDGNRYFRETEKVPSWL